MFSVEEISFEARDIKIRNGQWISEEYDVLDKLLGRYVNPFMTNGLSHCYHLDETTVIIRSIRSDFEFLFHFPMKFI